MQTVLFIHGGKVTGSEPSNRFSLRLDWAVEYYHRNHTSEDIVFLVSGRFSSATAEYPLTESEIGKRRILARITKARVIKEDVSLELIGNYAFSKPLIASLEPDKVIILNSAMMQTRSEFIAHKLFGNAFHYSFQFIEDELSGDQTLRDKESKALKLAASLLSKVPDGDDAKARDILLYQTPYYFKGLIDDASYFDKHWPGGFADFLAKRSIRHNKG